MEKIDISTNSRAIQESYNKVVRGDSGADYVVYSVNKSAALEVTDVASGSLDEFVDNFSDGQVQFGLARVTVPGSDVHKILLLGWCPDNAPAKLRLSFAANFADVSRVLSGYHVQITARDQDDLDVDDFLQRIGAAAGARYSIQTSGKPAPKPAVAKPAKPTVAKADSFIPKTTGKPIQNTFSKPSGPSIPKTTGKPIVSNDEWGGEAEIEERDFSKKPLEDVPSAYKPTKVNIAELRAQKSDTISSTPKKPAEPVAPKQDAKTEVPSVSDRMKAFKSDDGRLTELPKHKVNNAVAGRFKPAESGPGPKFGAKPSFGAKPQLASKPAEKLVGGASRNFAAEGGKTPAQIWAEKRGQYKVVDHDDAPVSEVSQSLAGTKVDDDDDEEEEEEEEEKAPPAPVLPNRNLPPPPVRNVQAEAPSPVLPARNLPPAPKEEEEAPPAPVLPARNLPPPPVRNVQAESPSPVLPARNLPPPPAQKEEEEEEEEAPPALPSREEPVSEEKTSSLSAIAQYDYEKDEDNEIGFEEGDLITDIDKVDEDWWSGKHAKTGEVGLFPATYVELQEAGASAAAPAAPAATAATAATAGPTATAEYEYEKDEDNEIGFAEGDLIVDIEFVDNDWWSGTHKASGETGLFPANYVKLN